MQPSELATLLMSAADRAGFFWNFYIVGIFALLGWRFSLKGPLSPVLKVLAILSFVLFAGMNCSALWGTYRVFQMLALELEAKSTSETFATAGMLALIKDLSGDRVRIQAVIVHGLTDITIIVTLLSDKLWVKHRPRSNSSVETPTPTEASEMS